MHADNCGGQNKNATMVQYLLYRVTAGLPEEVTLSFVITGHTKFSPDWCFGLRRKKYRRTLVGGLRRTQVGRLSDRFGCCREQVCSGQRRTIDWLRQWTCCGSHL